VLVVADDQLARAWLASLLAAQPDILVAGQAGGDEDWPATLDAYRPDALVWDLGWDPGRTTAAPRPGADTGRPQTALERLAEVRDLGVPVVALVPGEEYAAGTWAAGARGVLLREVTAEPLHAALRAVAQGLAVVEPQLSAALLPARSPAPETLAEPLTPREVEVLQLLAEGLSNKAIAARLDVSEHTVKFHVNALMGKLGATRLGLIVL
jgi:DNA-binding NarL/FixJ family response regulator